MYLIGIVFATISEHIASIYLGGYAYRFENVPAYVAPGHGMVYLSSVAMARSGLFFTLCKRNHLLSLCQLWFLFVVGYYARRTRGCSGSLVVLRVYCFYVQRALALIVFRCFFYYHMAGADWHSLRCLVLG